MTTATVTTKFFGLCNTSMGISKLHKKVRNEDEEMSLWSRNCKEFSVRAGHP